MIAKVDREDSRWIRCGKCGHRLMKVLNGKCAGKIIIETKCHSCKEVNVITERLIKGSDLGLQTVSET